MHRYILLFLALIIVAGLGCSELYLLERREDKLTGAWQFDRVYYKADDKLFRDDVSGDYKYDIVQFNSDYTAVYDDYSDGKVYDGEWIIRVDKDFDTDGVDTEYFVDAMFYGMLQGDNFDLFGTIDKLNRNKLHLEGRDRDGTYTFKLVRL